MFAYICTSIYAYISMYYIYLYISAQLSIYTNNECLLTYTSTVVVVSVVEKGRTAAGQKGGMIGPPPCPHPSDRPERSFPRSKLGNPLNKESLTYYDPQGAIYSSKQYQLLY